MVKVSDQWQLAQNNANSVGMDAPSSEDIQILGNSREQQLWGYWQTVTVCLAQ